MASTDDSPYQYEVREVVGTFENALSFEDAIEELEVSGMDRADISMLASQKSVEEKLGHLYHKTSELGDEGRVPQAIFASHHEIAEGKAAIVGIPAYIGGSGAGIAIVASGGTLAIAALVAAAGAAAGAGIGALFAHAVGEHHAQTLREHLTAGGLLLWVRVHNDAQEESAIAVLTRSGGKSVHAHSITRHWSEADIPLHDFNPDPLLERRPN